MIDLKIDDLKNIIKPEKIKEFLGDELNRMYLILGATALLAALYLSFLIIPKFSEFKKLSREVKDLNEKISLVNSRVKKLDATTKRLKALREEESLYSKQLPAEKEIPDFLEGLAATAEKSGVKILGVTPGELEKETGARGKRKQYYCAMPVLVTAKCGYHQLGEFINDLEKGKRFITVEDLRINYDPASPREHNVKMVLETYVSVE